jgi:hypothetical protein
MCKSGRQKKCLVNITYTRNAAKFSCRCVSVLVSLQWNLEVDVGPCNRKLLSSILGVTEKRQTRRKAETQNHRSKRRTSYDSGVAREVESAHVLIPRHYLPPDATLISFFQLICFSFQLMRPPFYGLPKPRSPGRNGNNFTKTSIRIRHNSNNVAICMFDG